MSLSEAMTSLMDASRHVYGGNDKRSIADLTALMTSPSSAYIIADSSVAEATDDGLTTSSVDGAMLLTVQSNSNHRILIPVGNNATVSDQMTLIIVARRSPKASANAIPIRIGGYDATTDFTISATDWKLYRVPLKTSASPYCSIYIDQQGPTIEYRYFALIKVGGN